MVLVLLVIITILAVITCVICVLNREIKETDAIKFLNEYNKYNDQINEKNGKKYVKVSINKDNTVKYINEQKAVELLEKGTGVIYFGFSTCPWCRSLVSTLTDVAYEKNEVIYYLDILDLRSSFELSEGKLNKIKDGTENYYKILDLLNDYLEEFYLEDESGNKFDTGEKRLYAPTLVAFKNGEITKIHVGTVESQQNGYDNLNDTQIKELEKTIKSLINSKNVEVCTNEKC